MTVPWALESPAGAIGGGGTEGLRYGAGWGEAFKSPGNVLLKKKQVDWIDGMKTPETTILVPTVYPERQVKWERSTFLLGQDSPIDIVELAERSAKRKSASEVQLFLLDQISERIRKRNTRQGVEKCASQNGAQVEEPPTVEVPVNRPEFDLVVTIGTLETKRGLNSRAVRRLGLEELSRQRRATMKEREFRVKQDLLQKKQNLEMAKEVARGHTKHFLEVGKRLLELETGSLVEPESHENVREAFSVQAKQPENLRVEVGEVENPLAKRNLNADHGMKPSLIPKLEKNLWTRDYDPPKINRGTGLRFQVLKDLKTLKEGKEELRDERELGNDAGGSTGSKPSSSFVPDRVGGLSPVKGRVSKIPVLSGSLRPKNYSPPRKPENTGFRYVAGTAQGGPNIKCTTFELSSGCGSSSMNLNRQRGMQMHGIQVG